MLNCIIRPCKQVGIKWHTGLAADNDFGLQLVQNWLAAAPTPLLSECRAACSKLHLQRILQSMLDRIVAIWTLHQIHCLDMG